MPDMHCIEGEEGNALPDWFQCVVTPPATGITALVQQTRPTRPSTFTGINNITSPHLIYGFGVRMVYESTDLTPAPTGSLTSSTTPPSSSEPAAGSGLSTGATIAIGVTVPLATLVASVTGFLVWRWKGKQRQKREGGADWEGRHELPTKPHERLPPDPLHEMSCEGVIAEMPVNQQKVELPG
jgi:hypothetical protein